MRKSGQLGAKGHDTTVCMPGMKLPHLDQVSVPQSKIVDYLLSPTHPEGRSKALFFARFGFTLEACDFLADALRRHAAEHEVAKEETSPFGTRYVVEGILRTPSGRTPRIRAVWFIDGGANVPRFVTAYPLAGD